MTKRWKDMLAIAAVCLLVWLLPSLALAEPYAFGVTSKSNYVNLRAKPSSSSTWRGAYARDTWMAISGESGNWYYVTAPDGKEGYMSKNYVTVNPERYATIGVVTNPKASSYLNLRKTPSYSAQVLGTYYNGVPCVLLSYSGGWYAVRVDGVEGYFREEYIQRRYTPYAEEIATIVTPNNTGLNLRKGPGMGYGSIGQYRGGGYVMILQRGMGWWKVVADGQIGFMNSDFLRAGVLKPDLTSSVTPEKPASTGVTGSAVVKNPRPTQLLNLRESPTTASRVLGRFGNGEKVLLLRQGTKWCRVCTLEGVVGYMMTDYLDISGGTSKPTMKVSHPQKSYVNLRSAPSMEEGKVLARMPHGASVVVEIPGDSWVQVSYGGRSGYAVAYFLK